MGVSKFADTRGILLAGDTDTYEELVELLRVVHSEISALKLGTSIIYKYGAGIIEKIKKDFHIPVIADVKVTDVAHIASTTAKIFEDNGADAIVISAICGPDAIQKVSNTLNECETWVFTEFTSDTGLINEKLADQSIRMALENGAVGFQGPGTRVHRIEDLRDQIGDSNAIMSCGIGVQGGSFGSAIRAGANLEIIGRSIYASNDPLRSVRNINSRIKSELNPTESTY